MLGIPESHLGHAAGLAAAVAWTITSLLFTAAGRRIGASFVNATRIALAVLLLAVTHRVWHGVWVPEMHWGQAVYLALSGVVGLTLGDLALFSAFVRIGPRLSMLILSTAPIVAALLGWVALGETVSLGGGLGILMTVGGVAWVVRERPQHDHPQRAAQHGRGVALAFIATAGQAGGLLLSKLGMGHGWLEAAPLLGAEAATMVRMFFAGVTMAPLALLLRVGSKRAGAGHGPVASRHRVRDGLLLTAAAACLGSYLGVWMSLEAAHRTSVGVAQTLMSLPPVLILPLSRMVHSERITVRAVLGAIVAVAGVGILCLTADGTV